MNADEEFQIKEEWVKYGQGHVFQYEHLLNPSEKTKLYKNLLTYPISLINSLKESLQNYLNKLNITSTEPFHYSTLNEWDVTSLNSRTQTNFPLKVVNRDMQSEFFNQMRNEGLKLIAHGSVALIIMAGGDATRMGPILCPKGCLPCTPYLNKSLFQVYLERILKLNQLADPTCSQYALKSSLISIYIMTSPSNHKSTEMFLKDHNYFGVPEKQIMLFQQNLLPCFTSDGNVILNEKYCLAQSPCGNGDLWTALLNHQILEVMQVRNTKWVHITNIDNLLCRVCDPLFVGLCNHLDINVGLKTIERRKGEKVGIVHQAENEKVRVIEYSETNSEINKLNEKGSYVYTDGNISSFCYKFEFMKLICSQLHSQSLSYHWALKKIPYFDSKQQAQLFPSLPNAYKPEKFIFDSLELTKHVLVYQIPRDQEFAPIKNANGADSCQTATEALMKLHASWIQQHQQKLNCPHFARAFTLPKPCEISPLISYEGENLDAYLQNVTFDNSSPIILQDAFEMQRKTNTL